MTWFAFDPDALFGANPCGPGDRGPRARAKGGWGWGWGDGATFMGGIFGPGGPGGGRSPFRGRGGRMFEQGDLRYVILRLLEEKPRHGYEIIKAIEEKFGGAYAPSPGTVYPTLQLLEDQGFARVTPEDGGKKIYAITDAGRAHLHENKDAVDTIFERVARVVEHLFDEPMGAVHGAMKRVARATYSRATQATQQPAELQRIVAILERAAREIEAGGADTRGAPPASPAPDPAP